MQPKFEIGLRRGTIFIDDEGGNRVADLCVSNAKDVIEPDLECALVEPLPQIPVRSPLSALDVSVLVDALFELVKNNPRAGIALNRVPSGVVCRDLGTEGIETILAVSPDLVTKVVRGVQEKVCSALRGASDEFTRPCPPGAISTAMQSCENPAP